ncbi:MAG: PadR family transcriptional regulator [Peptococcaceae bacterium]|nr:PadR family transcriptional regulator [Peptococcaceae bacterium]
MYELLVLSWLMYFPLHAYLIIKISNDTIGPWEKISQGSLSALLKKLAAKGLITEADPASVPFPSARTTRSWAITSQGRERFFQLMLDTAANPGNYQKIFHIIYLHMHLLSPDDQLYLYSHYLRYGQEILRHLTTEAVDFDEKQDKGGGDPFNTAVLELMAHTREQWQLEMGWARYHYEKTLTQLKAEQSLISKGEKRPCNSNKEV